MLTTSSGELAAAISVKLTMSLNNTVAWSNFSGWMYEIKSDGVNQVGV